jgi:Pyruvate/2-oxoacid:ferredoxin oxidoreductase delta subunit
MDKTDEETALILESMANNGLVFTLNTPNGKMYAALPYMVGIFDFQLGRLDRELADLIEQYNEEAMTERMSQHLLQVRTIPLGTSLAPRFDPVEPYENAVAIVGEQTDIAVAPCMCRKLNAVRDKPCRKPDEVCFFFGVLAHHYVDRKMARKVGREEALSILEETERAGLVHQPSVGINAGALCNCCSCCCHMLEALRRNPKPRGILITNHYAVVRENACISCGTCGERCPMHAVRATENGMRIDKDRCIGCGVCVGSCPEGCIEILSVPSHERRTPPKRNFDYYIQTAMRRKRTLTPIILRNRKT